MNGARRVAVGLGLLLTVGIVGLHIVFHRHAGALWRDEVNSVNLAALPSLADVVANSHLDTFGVPWVTLLHGWMSWGLGDSDAGLRRFGLAIGLATLPVLWWSARRLGLDAPLMTLLLYGMSPSVIVYGGSLRGYGLGALALAWCLGAVWAFVATPTWRTFAVAQLSAVLAVQTYFPNGVLLVAICAGAFVVCVRRDAWRLCAAVAGLGLVAAASLGANIPWIANAFRLGALEQQNPSFGQLLGVFHEAPAGGVNALAALWVVAPCFAVLGCAVGLRAADDPVRPSSRPALRPRWSATSSTSTTSPASPRSTGTISRCWSSWRSPATSASTSSSAARGGQPGPGSPPSRSLRCRSGAALRGRLPSA